MPPNAEIAASAIAAVSISEATSAGMPIARRPCAASRPAASAAFAISATTTAAPRSESASAIAYPIPIAPPVTIATLPESCIEPPSAESPRPSAGIKCIRAMIGAAVDL